MRVIHPPHFPRPKGYSDGIVGEGPLLFLAGQIGWELDGTFAAPPPGVSVLGWQFGRALDHVRDLLAEAGTGPERIVSMTVYVTDLEAYRSGLAEIGAIWRARLGRCFPAMALVGVAGLVEREAVVEIQVVAELPPGQATPHPAAVPPPSPRRGEGTSGETSGETGDGGVG